MHKNLKVFILTGCVLLGGLFWLYQSGMVGAHAEPRPESPAVSVGERDIPRWMYENALNDRLAGEPEADKARLSRIKKEIIDNLISMELLRAEAERLGYTVNEAGGRLRSTIVEGSFGDKDLFEATLNEAGMTREQYAELWRQQAMVNMLIDGEIKAKVSVSDEEVAALYEEEWSRFGDDGLEEVWGMLEGAIRDAKARMALDEYIARLRQQTTIKIHVR